MKINAGNSLQRRFYHKLPKDDQQRIRDAVLTKIREFIYDQGLGAYFARSLTSDQLKLGETLVWEIYKSDKDLCEHIRHRRKVRVNSYNMRSINDFRSKSLRIRTDFIKFCIPIIFKHMKDGESRSWVFSKSSDEIHCSSTLIEEIAMRHTNIGDIINVLQTLKLGCHDDAISLIKIKG